MNRLIFFFIMFYLSLPSCSPGENSGSNKDEYVFSGKRFLFQSDLDSKVVVLFVDHGSYRNYGSLAEVGLDSDVGGSLEPCKGGLNECVDLNGLFIMVPPSGLSVWKYGGYEFNIASDGVGRNGVVVVVSRGNEELYSYNYRSNCGVGWVNFSRGRESGEEVFYPVGEALFSTSECE